MKTLLDDPYLQWTQTEFVELQNLAECQLTLVNARLPAQADEELFAGLNLMYHTGKRIGSLMCQLLTNLFIQKRRTDTVIFHHATTTFSQQCGRWATTFQAGMQLVKLPWPLALNQVKLSTVYGI